MSDRHHSMTVEWEVTYLGCTPTYTPTCAAPPEALCRAIWDCGCESFDGMGVDAKGPWHTSTGYDYRVDEEVTARHYGTPGGECGQLLFITESDCIDELGSVKVTFPIDLKWDGDCYEWHVADEARR